MPLSPSIDEHEHSPTKSSSPVEPPTSDSNSDSSYVQSQGVSRIEAVALAAKTNKTTLYILASCIFIVAFVYALDQSTTYNYDVFATSGFASHSSGLAALDIATMLVGSIGQIFLAKFSDITARPYIYLFALVFYALGYTIAATARTLASFIVGKVFRALGSAALVLVNSLLIADLTPLQWRGFSAGVLSTPFIVNVWFAGQIVEALTNRNQWRWGYGMFAIIMPVFLGPAVATLLYLDRKAQKQGLVSFSSSGYARQAANPNPNANKDVEDGEADKHSSSSAVPPTTTPISRRTLVLSILTELDAVGLILLGFGWSLLLLPFSLQAKAKGNWANPSLIAMFVVGGVLVITYFIYETLFAKRPMAPRRLLVNRTFMMAVVIDFVYYLAGYIQSLYFSSYVFVVQNWSVSNWTYFNNTLTISLCLFGLIAGIIQRVTHRYKAMQVIGLIAKFIGYAITLRGSGALGNRWVATDTATLVWTQILVGLGGGFSVVASQVASQASVPHQDVAAVIALLSLWTSIGGSIGSAIAAAIWGTYMPRNLRKYMPAEVTDEQVAEFFGSIVAVREFGMDSAVRQGAIRAYQETMWYLTTPAVVLSILPIVAACFQTNYYLGRQQNAVMNVGTDGRVLEDDPALLVEAEAEEARKPQTLKERVLRTLRA